VPLDLAEAITLERQVTLAERVLVLTHLNVGYADHPLQPHFPPVAKPVHVEQGAFLGANVTVLAGVRIGRCAFVAAGSVVTADVAPWTLVAGVPARPVRRLGPAQAEPVRG
jgi:acetyltransferase-like isoleucine patch superfamily enzyme